MSNGSDLVPLGDMYDYARKVSTRLRDVSREQFDQNEDLRFAVVHWLQIVGEAARRALMNALSKFVPPDPGSDIDTVKERHARRPRARHPHPPRPDRRVLPEVAHPQAVVLRLGGAG
jgi:hypothetical protein